MITILSVQSLLNAVTGSKLVVDGRDGPATQAALAKYRADRGIAATDSYPDPVVRSLRDDLLARVTPEALVAVGVSSQNAARFAPVLRARLAAWEIDTPRRLTYFLANALHESGCLGSFVENINYSAEGLARTWPNRYAEGGQPNALARSIARNPEAIANSSYSGRGGNTEPGDGWRFRGRGIFQLTFRSNYDACGEDLKLDLIGNPDLVATDATVMVDTACWYWKRTKLTHYADQGLFDNVCDLINRGSVTAKVGDSIGYTDRVKKLELLVKNLCG